jgi:mRNA interferase RelE/StbE
MYRVFLERAAEKQLKQLPAKLHDRVIEAVQALSKDPRPTRCRKLTGTDNDWRIRVGDYRVIYEIDEKAREIRVNRIRHRREVYR